MSLAMRKQAAALFNFANAALVLQSSLDHDARAVLHLVTDVLFTEQFLLTSPKPRYVAYTNLRVLDRYLGGDDAAAPEQKWEAARRALALIVADWYELERKRLSLYAAGKLGDAPLGYENPATPEDKVAHLKARERLLGLLARHAFVEGLSDARIDLADAGSRSSDWVYFAETPDKQVTHLACMPRSNWHDEYLFLRMIHATECCFAGIIAGLVAVPPVIRRGDFAEAATILNRALYFSDFLTRLFALADTMPVGNFYGGFRPATGNASAIQSIRFQTIEVLTRGLGERKRDALSRQREVCSFSKWIPPREATLAGMCEAAQRGHGAGNAFFEVADRLDRDLYKWRAKHAGLARKYLPADAVGTGMEGVPYLDENFKAPRSCLG